MATRSTGNSSGTRRSSSSTARRSSSAGTRKTSTGRQSSSSRKSAPVQPEAGFIEKIISSPINSRLADAPYLISRYPGYRRYRSSVSWNDFSRFFKILGIELLVAVIVWILKLVFSKSKSSDDSVSEV